MEQKLVEYFQEKYNPLAIILHGSRARGMARPHSDWDVLMVVKDKPNTALHGDVFEGEMIDPEFLVLPLSDEHILEHLHKFQNVKILLDTENVGSSLIQRADIFTAQGINLTKVEIENCKHFLLRAIYRLEDTLDDDMLFHYRFWKDCFSRAFKYWYEIKHNQYQKPLYIARQEIAEKDPEYFEMIKPLWESNDNKTKLETAKKFFNYIFQN